jgi:hypothetical protein
MAPNKSSRGNAPSSSQSNTPPFHTGIQLTNRNSILDGEILKITVGTGDDTKQYKIDRGLLSHASPFFRAASTNGLAETTSGHIKLPEDKPAAFDIFLHWAYTSKVLPILDVEVTKPEIYLHGMVTADKLLVPDLVQECWTHIRNWFSTTEFPTPNFINELYALNPSIYCVSNARKYFVGAVRAFIASNMHLDKWEAILACNESFLVGLATQIVTKQKIRIIEEDKDRDDGRQDNPHTALEWHPFGKLKYAAAVENIALDSKVHRINNAVKVVMDIYHNMDYEAMDTQFSTWPLIKPSGEDMAAAGFMCYLGKHAECPVCDLYEYDWNEGEDPLAVHRSQECQFVDLMDAGVRVPLLDDYRRGLPMSKP